MAREYRNPVVPQNCPDPFVLRFNGRYYAYGTGEAGDGRYFPVYSSSDLLSWEFEGGALPPLAGADAHDYWAPEVAYDNGVFYLYYAVVVGREAQHHLRLATAADPLGPWTDQDLNLTPDEIFAIDPHPFQDRDGQWYLYYARDWLEPPFTGTGIVVDRLEGFRRLAGKPARVLRPYADWQLFELQRAEKGGADWYTVEGPYTVRHRGQYVCFYSGGRWEHPNYGVGYLRSDVPDDDRGLDGPGWEVPEREREPVLLRTRPGEVIGPGHNSLITAPNNVAPYLVYHGWDPALTARMMRIDRLRWHGTAPTLDGPTTDPRPAPPPPAFAARFAEGELAGWQTAGSWELAAGRLRALAAGPASARLPGPGWSHWLLEASLRLPGGKGPGARLMVADSGGTPFLEVGIRPDAGELRLLGWKDGRPVAIAAPLPAGFRPEAWHRLLLTRNAGTARALLDGYPEVQLVIDAEGPLAAALACAGATGTELAACALTPHFADDFEDGTPAGWTRYDHTGGLWRPVEGATKGEPPGPSPRPRGRRCFLKGDPMRSFESTVEFELGAARRAGLLLGDPLDGRFELLIGGGDGQAAHFLEAATPGQSSAVNLPVPWLDPGSLTSIHAEVRGGTLSVWIDGRALHHAHEGMAYLNGVSGRAGFVTEGAGARLHHASMTWLPDPAEPADRRDIGVQAGLSSSGR
jgi:GH43 family beta-xylosidase